MFSQRFQRTIVQRSIIRDENGWTLRVFVPRICLPITLQYSIYTRLSVIK